ncbi:MAG TPA: hypothetical protein VD867_18590, partial [Burkholderiales bacterium]|nr:hypothetical protein [Burkholderiales bacterium]
WDWEMPVVTLWVFALGGAAIAAVPTIAAPAHPLAIFPRAVIAVVCGVLVLLAPLRLIVSEVQLDSATAAYARNDCRQVSVLTGRALEAVAERPEPRELRAVCELRSGRSREAIATLARAARSDPANWRPRYALAVVQARAGRDPRAAIRAARRLNPRNQIVERAAVAFERASNGKQWRQAGRRITVRSLVPPV